MKLKLFKLLALIALLIGGFSCTKAGEEPLVEQNKWYWDGIQQEEFQPINPGTDSSSFMIDSNIISFAVPYLIGNLVFEVLSSDNNPHRWNILLFMSEGIDVTKLSPIITLAPGATIILKEYTIGGQYTLEQVNLTGIVEVGAADFFHTQTVRYTLNAPDGSTAIYIFSAIAEGTDIGPCVNCD